MSNANSHNKLKELEDKYLELGKEIEKLKVKEEVKFPKIGDKYWLTKMTGEIAASRYHGDFFDQNCISIGNFYQFKEQAEAEVDYRKVITELRSCEGARKFKYEEYNYTIGCNSAVTSLFVNNYSQGLAGVLSVYFIDIDSCKLAIEKVGEERIIKAIKWLVYQEY